MCISVCLHVACALPVLLHLVVVLCLCECVHAEEGSEEKMMEE